MQSDECGHHFTHALHAPVTRRKHGLMWMDTVTCSDCPAKVTLRVYDDPRDDPERLYTPRHPRLRGREG